MTTADDPVWALVRRDYENGVTQLTLSEKYNFDRKTIRRRIRLEGWSVITQHERDDAIIAQAAEEARSPQNRPTSPGDPQDERAAIILAHRREWKDIDRLRAEAQKAALEPGYKPEDLTQDEEAQWSSHKRLAYAKTLASLYRTLVEGLTSKQEGESRAHGLTTSSSRRRRSTRRPWRSRGKLPWPSTSSWTTSSASMVRSSTEAPAQGRVPTETPAQSSAGRLLRPAGQGPAALH